MTTLPGRVSRSSLLAGLVAMVLVAPFALVAAFSAADDARRATTDAAAALLHDARLAHWTGETGPTNSWIASPDGGWFDPLGEATIDAPVASVARVAMDHNGAEERYDYDGTWLLVGEVVNADQVILVAVDRSEEDGAVRAAWLRWLTATIVAGLAGATAAEWWERRRESPTDRAHAVNRDFIADAAHELRTPLSIVQASAGHALARERSSDEYREALAEILTATERAGASVGELLEFARLEAGQASPRLAPLRLDLLVEEVASSIRVDGTSVEAVVGDAVVVEADYQLVRQVVDNIARNAAARASKVTLRTAMERTEARIEVVDDGPGFDPGIVEHVFERFRRGDRSGSVGLGMAIARTIVELHGGRVAARNTDEGTGAVVEVWLPYSPRPTGGSSTRTS